MKNFLLVLCIIISASLNGQVIYSADFSTNGAGFPDHDTNNPPAAAPAFAIGGIPPNDWIISYTAVPGTDGSANSFSVTGGAIASSDWGGTAHFNSASIDVTGVLEVDITAIGETVGSSVQNASSEFFRYFYILDGGLPVFFPIVLIGDSAGDPVNYSVPALDVSSASSIVVGFSFNCNGSGDGYSVSSFEVEATVLPVNLTMFEGEASKKDIALNWQTAQELNNSHFEIQHSTDNRTFTTIGKEEGAGNSDVNIDYSFAHDNPTNGINYYRLQQFDFDGQSEYSQIVSVRFGKEAGLAVYPNPVQSEVTIALGEEFATNATAEVISQNGRTVLRETFTAKSFTQTMNVNNLSAGVYVLRVVNGNEVYTKRFIKK